ncbi:MAG: signal peptidase II [Gammaproteobacteria bacterium]|nr:signal peptidase II [Gammaproteobacteria bacterium]
MKKWVWLAVLAVVLDQITKIWANGALELHQRVDFLPMLNITLMYNEGAAFSFLSNAGGWQRWFFTVLAIAVSIFIIVWLRKLPEDENVQAAGLSLVLGGAIGNVLDRMMHGHVIDFIDFFYQSESCFVGFYYGGNGECHWPAFNIADSAIFLGAILLIATSFKSEKKNPQEL